MRRLAFVTSLLLTLIGAILTVVQLEGRAEDARLAEHRLKPDSPLVEIPEGAGGRARVPLGTRLARLRIPAIEVDEIVVEGVRMRDLAIGIGHYPGTAPIGGEGVAGIAGHRTGWGSPLLRLDELEPGDEIFLQTPQDTDTYVVTRTAVVPPQAKWVLEGDPASEAARRLTITTCTPPYTSLERLVVWADLAI